MDSDIPPLSTNTYQQARVHRLKILLLSPPSRLSTITSSIVAKRGIFCLQFSENMSSKDPGNVQEERTGVGGASCHVSRLQLFELELLHPGRRTQWASCVMVRPQEGGNRMVHRLNRQLVSNLRNISFKYKFSRIHPYHSFKPKHVYDFRDSDSRKASLYFAPKFKSRPN